MMSSQSPTKWMPWWRRVTPLPGAVEPSIVTCPWLTRRRVLSSMVPLPRTMIRTPPTVVAMGEPWK